MPYRTPLSSYRRSESAFHKEIKLKTATFDMKAYQKKWYQDNKERLRPRRKEQARRWRIENRDKWSPRLRTRRLRLFGITEEQYDSMVKSQGGVCASCGLPETATRNGVVKQLAVDHCHATGIIRGLLCQRCNLLLGLADDDIHVLLKAVEYLAPPGGKD